MRAVGFLAGMFVAAIAAPPAFAFDELRLGAHALPAIERESPVAPRPGRALGALVVDGRPVTFTAFGRRARARALNNFDEVRHARAMGKVFDGAPQPAIFTLTATVRF